MKNLLILTLLSILLTLSACTTSPTFKVGDCILFAPKNIESWDMFYHPRRIIEIGKYSYHVEWFDLDSKTWESTHFNVDFTDERLFQKIKCPESNQTCDPRPGEICEWRNR